MSEREPYFGADCCAREAPMANDEALVDIVAFELACDAEMTEADEITARRIVGVLRAAGHIPPPGVYVPAARLRAVEAERDALREAAQTAWAQLNANLYHSAFQTLGRALADTAPQPEEKP